MKYLWFIVPFVVIVGLLLFYNTERYDYKGNITIWNNDTKAVEWWQSVSRQSDIKGLDFEGSYVIIHYENGYHRAVPNADITWSE